MKKYMTLNEIKSLTKSEFKKHLLSEGYKVIDSPTDYQLLLVDVDNKTHSHVCSLYGASGYYSAERKAGSLGNWGCYDSMYEFIPRNIKVNKEKIREAICKQGHQANIKQSGYLHIITVNSIPEKEFRQLMVDHHCYCAHFDEKDKKGILIFN